MSEISEEVIHAAQEAMRQTGVPASISLGQYILESDSGKHMPPGSNNPFGYKSSGDQPHVMAWTHEFVHGRWIRVQAPFRKFASLEEAFRSHANLLAYGKPYEAIRYLLHNPEKYVPEMARIYATDPQYAQELLHIMNESSIWKYDKLSPQTVGKE